MGPCVKLVGLIFWGRWCIFSYLLGCRDKSFICYFVTPLYAQTRGVPELLAYYSDSIMKKGQQSQMNETEYEQIFDKISSILGLLTQKDIFLQIYQNLLADRLLFELSESDEFEHQLISKLKLKYWIRSENTPHTSPPRTQTRYHRSLTKLRAQTTISKIPVGPPPQPPRSSLRLLANLRHPVPPRITRHSSYGP